MTRGPWRADILSRKRLLFAMVIGLACLRCAHVHLLWSDEDYHLAAAIQIVNGRLPYRDFWYDKPPLDAIYYLLIGGYSGWPLRVLDSLYVGAASWLAYRIARERWTESEGWLAALLLAFFLTFYLPAAVIPFAADALLIVPHLAAVLCAQRRSLLWAGVWAGVGFLINTKSIFVLATCVVWVFPSMLLVFGGFAAPLLIAAAVGGATGMWGGYMEQVWRWGLMYAGSSPGANAVLRIADWAGFHASIVAGALIGLRGERGRDRWRLLAWIALSFLSVCVGDRFVPRYFLQLLPPMIVVGSRGLAVAVRRYGRKGEVAAAVLLLVPLVRFGPRYLTLTADDLKSQEPRWTDAAMDEDARRVANVVRVMARPGDSLFVWGYRPDVYVYARMIPDGKFWDSQPLTGVPADRHLSSSEPVFAAGAAQNRLALAHSHPTFVVDGLGLLNPRLAAERYPELRSWLGGYDLIGRTGMSLIYCRR
ncbi:MAG: glycosyltransferase family 39 protein [Acidobacteriaceae bacterium]|nr:glycosyltransferase family 39 protein [Acidobacteriaceae bacterium]